METLISIVGGGILSILTVIFVEWLRKPSLALRIETPILDLAATENEPAKRHLRLVMRNKPLFWGFRWLQRNAALQCRGEITFLNLDGQNICGRGMAVRWVNSPEPISASAQIIDLQNQPVYRLVNFTGMESKMDVYPGEEEMLDVAVRYERETDCYGWNNESYFHHWRNRAFRLHRGTYLVKVVISSSGDKITAGFRLLNEVDTLTGFRLTPLLDIDEGKI